MRSDLIKLSFGMNILSELIEENADDIQQIEERDGEYTDYDDMFFKYINRGLVQQIDDDDLIDKLRKLFIYN